MPRLTRPNYRAVKATPEESRGMYNPPRVLEVKYRRKVLRLVISPGRTDDIDVSARGDLVYVACVRRSFPYLGCEVFNLDGVRVADFFAQGSDQCADIFGHELPDDGSDVRWEEWSERYLYAQIRAVADQLV